jgi:hypothetical protein
MEKITHISVTFNFPRNLCMFQNVTFAEHSAVSESDEYNVVRFAEIKAWVSAAKEASCQSIFAGLYHHSLSYEVFSPKNCLPSFRAFPFAVARPAEC